MGPQSVEPNPTNPNPPQNAATPASQPSVQPEALPRPVAVVSGPTANQQSPVAAPQFVSSSQLATASKSSKRLLLIILSLVVILGIGGGGAFFYLSWKPSPDKVFTGYLNTLLQTKSVTQKASSADGTGTILFDLSDVKQPKDSFTADLAVSGIKFNLDGYGSLQNDYVKFNKIEVSGVDTSKVTVTNKWIQLRSQGKLSPGVDGSLVQIMDPRYLALGDVVFGNFSASDRADLVAAAKQHPFFKYDTKKVKKETLDGQSVYVYDVTVDKNALGDYNKKVGKIMGISDADVTDGLQTLQSESSNFTIYVRLDNKQIMKSTTTGSNNAPVTNLYSDYNKTTVPAEPKGEITYEQFQQGLLGPSGQ